MQKKFIATAIIAAVTLVIWIYWSSNIEMNNTMTILKKNHYFIENYILRPSSTICKKKPSIVIIITSYAGHVELRSAHRRAMPPDLLQSMNIVRIFLLASIPTTEKFITQKSIKDEHNIFGDILQGSFVENYRNLTHKHLMGLRWASTACSEARFILKVDDDIVYNLDRTNKLLLNLNDIDKHNFIMGYILNNTKPRRNKQNKWYVTWDEYSRNDYPPYLSGWYYITSPQVALRIADEAIYHPYFWIDDIFLSGILTEALNIKLIQVPQDFWLEYYELLECCLRDMIKFYVRCDYVVAPNGGRDNLLVEFSKAIRQCDSWNNCTARHVNEPLNKVCVSYKERDIFSDGQGEVQYIKV